MSVIIITLFGLFNFFVSNGWAPRKALPFPHLIDFKESDIGKPVYTFEGVDYSLLPKKLFKDYSICEEEYTRCIRFIIYSSPVCGYNPNQDYLSGYPSLCELDLESCREMYRMGVPMYGTNYRYRGVYYLGEGYDCEIYLRRVAEGMIPKDIRDLSEVSTPNLTATIEYESYDDIVS